MYKIKAEGKEYYSDTLVYVKKAPNGCYVPCLAEEAEYVVAKVPCLTQMRSAAFPQIVKCGFLRHCTITGKLQ